MVLTSGVNLGMWSASRKAVVEEVWPCTKTDKNLQHSLSQSQHSLVTLFPPTPLLWGKERISNWDISKSASAVGWRKGESKGMWFY